MNNPLSSSRCRTASNSWMGVEQVRALCPRCATIMEKRGLKSIKSSLIVKARDNELAKRIAYGWTALPKGWTKDTLTRYWDKMGGSVSSCIDKMQKHMGAGAGGFCAGLADMVKGKEWRNEPRKKKETT